ncbi:uncharacterized protein LOC141850639 [Brevipalpus obovatus]|uniref:uncharacterized protein LOC141850639 n=1 Tax=Brevipalpus obovatus TaxID=246614 RepID=UPI003D9E044A
MVAMMIEVIFLVLVFHTPYIHSKIIIHAPDYNEIASVHYEPSVPLNNQVFFPCLKPLCDEDYGCFEPFVYMGIPISLPPFAGCPEISRKKTIRFLCLSKKFPYAFQSVEIIEPQSKVAVLIHGLQIEYDITIMKLVGLSLLSHYDYVVFVDWAYLTQPYFAYRIPSSAALLALTNGILVGRAVCKFNHWLVKTKYIDPREIKIVGFSGGATALAAVGEFCKQKYGMIFGHAVAIELLGPPFRNNYRYHMTNYSTAETVDIILTTISPPLFEFNPFEGYGPLEAAGSCVYILNPKSILIDQPGCNNIPICAHLVAPIVFAAGESGKCWYRYNQCPIQFGYSPPISGYTRFNCRDHPKQKRLCVETSSSPWVNC